MRRKRIHNIDFLIRPETKVCTNATTSEIRMLPARNFGPGAYNEKNIIHSPPVSSTAAKRQTIITASDKNRMEKEAKKTFHFIRESIACGVTTLLARATMIELTS
jgi:hypothetical protein